ncbi:MAG TPA: hypothetical protein VNF99_04715 [Stellaceae bacterium]|nr:hypothetical protein [Stellaceae bacterium]
MGDPSFVESLMKEREEYTRLLDRLENGTERLAKRAYGARQWKDTTTDEIARTKRIIASLDAEIAANRYWLTMPTAVGLARG